MTAGRSAGARNRVAWPVLAVASGRPQFLRYVTGKMFRDPRGGRGGWADRRGDSVTPRAIRALPGQDGRPFRQHPGGIGAWAGAL